MKIAARFTTHAVKACAFAIYTIDSFVDIQREFEYRNIVFEAQAEVFAFVLFGLVSAIDFVWSGCANGMIRVASCHRSY